MADVADVNGNCWLHGQAYIHRLDRQTCSVQVPNDGTVGTRHATTWLCRFQYPATAATDESYLVEWVQACEDHADVPQHDMRSPFDPLCNTTNIAKQSPPQIRPHGMMMMRCSPGQCVKSHLHLCKPQQARLHWQTAAVKLCCQLACWAEVHCMGHCAGAPCCVCAVHAENAVLTFQQAARLACAAQSVICWQSAQLQVRQTNILCLP